jgi:hypothetical protein
VVRIIGFFCTPARTKAEDAKGQEARHLVEALGGGHGVGLEQFTHRRARAAQQPWAENNHDHTGIIVESNVQRNTPKKNVPDRSISKNKPATLRSIQDRLAGSPRLGNQDRDRGFEATVPKARRSKTATLAHRLPTVSFLPIVEPGGEYRRGQRWAV